MSILSQLRHRLRYARELIMALAFDTMDVATGTVIALAVSLAPNPSILLLVLPPLLTLRGSANGVLSAHLTSALHLGEVLPRFRGNTEQFGALLSATFALGVITCVAMLGIWLPLVRDTTSAPSLVLVVLGTYTMASVASLFLTSYFAFVTYSRGLDPDLVVYGFSSTLNDVLIGVSLLAVALVLSADPPTVLALAVAVTAADLVALSVLVGRYRRSGTFLRTLREGLASSWLSMMLSMANGAVLASLALTAPLRSALVVWPLLQCYVGDIVSHICCFYTTRLHLGEVRPSLREFFEAHTDLVISALVLLLCFASAVTLCVTLALREEIALALATVLAAASVSFVGLTLVGVSVSNLAFIRGRSPDSFIIPIVTSAADLTTTGLLFSLLHVFRLGV